MMSFCYFWHVYYVMLHHSLSQLETALLVFRSSEASDMFT